MTIRWYAGSQFGRSTGIEPTVTVASNGEIRFNCELCRLVGSKPEWAILGVDDESNAIVIELRNKRPPAGAHMVRSRQRKNELDTIIIPARQFLMAEGIDFSTTRVVSASYSDGIVIAAIGAVLAELTQQPPEKTTEADAPQNWAFPDQHGQVYFVDRADKAGRFTAWKRDGDDVVCMASILEDKTYTTYAAALKALTTFAGTQPHWQRCDIKLARRDQHGR